MSPGPLLGGNLGMELGCLQKNGDSFLEQQRLGLPTEPPRWGSGQSLGPAAGAPRGRGAGAGAGRGAVARARPPPGFLPSDRTPPP